MFLLAFLSLLLLLSATNAQALVTTCGGTYGPAAGPAVTTGNRYLASSLGLGNGSCATYNKTTNSCTGGSDTAHSDYSTAVAALPSGQTLAVRAGTYTEAAKVTLNSRTVVAYNKETVNLVGCTELAGTGAKVQGVIATNSAAVPCGEGNSAISIATCTDCSVWYSRVSGGAANSFSLSVASTATRPIIDGVDFVATHATERFGLASHSFNGMQVRNSRFDASASTEVGDGFAWPSDGRTNPGSIGEDSHVINNCFFDIPTDTYIDMKSALGQQTVYVTDNMFLGQNKGGTSYPCLLIPDSKTATVQHPRAVVSGNYFQHCTVNQANGKAITLHDQWQHASFGGALQSHHNGHIIENNVFVCTTDGDQGMQIPSTVDSAPNFRNNTLINCNMGIQANVQTQGWTSNIHEGGAQAGSATLSAAPQTPGCSHNNVRNVTDIYTAAMTCTNGTVANPGFVAGDNYNITEATLVGTGLGGTTRGAFQPPTPISGTTVNANTIRVTFNVVHPPLLVASNCVGIAAAGTVTGALTETACAVSGDVSVDITVAQTLVSTDVIDVDFSQGSVTTSQRIGGTAGPGFFAQILTTNNVAITNTIGGGGSDLLAGIDAFASSGIFVAGKDCTQLTDGSGTGIVAIGQSSVSCEWDTGSSQALGTSIVTGDADGACRCVDYDIGTKVNIGDSYVNAVTAATCNGNQEFVQPLSTTGRYVKFTVRGPTPTGSGGTCTTDLGIQAFKVAVSPGTPTTEGVFSQTTFWFRQAEVDGETWTGRSKFANAQEGQSVVLSPGARFQLRIKYGCGGGAACDDAAFALYTRACTPTCIEEEGWAPVGTTLNGNRALLAGDSTVQHGDVTTEQLTAASTFVPGQYYTTTATTQTSSFANGEEKEAVFVLAIDATVVVGTDTVQFKMFQSSGEHINGTPAQVVIGQAYAAR